jgi:4-amino-4-deoxy-L-arabinose transferase-like glycosyltransferase
MMEKEIEIEIRKPEVFLLIIFSIFVLYLELQVTFNSPIAFGDEAFHTEMSKYMAESIEYPIYTPFESTKIQKGGYARPPLWNILEASFYLLFGFNEAIVKFLVPLMAVMTGIACYVIIKKVYSTNMALIAAVLLVTVPSFVTYSVLFYVDVSEVFWLVLAVSLTLLAAKTESKKYWGLSAVFSGLVFLTKTTGLFLVFFYLFYFIYEMISRKSLLAVVKKYWIIVAIIAVIIGPWLLRNIYFYGNPNCSDMPFFSTKGCEVKTDYKPKYEFVGRIEETGTEASALKIGLVSYLDFAYGTIWLVPLTFLCGLMFLLKNRSKENIVLLIFLIASFIIIYRTFETRAEDLARYSLVALPLIATISAMYLNQIAENLKKYHTSLVYVLLILILIAAFFNMNGKISAARTFDESSQSYVGYKMFSKNFFDACNWIKQNTPKDSTLLSVHTHPTVYNCQRNAIWELGDLPDIILSNNVTLVLERLKLHGISYIFVQKFSLSSQAYRVSYPISFVQFLEQNENNFKNVYENGPDMTSCARAGGCDGTIVYKVVG